RGRRGNSRAGPNGADAPHRQLPPTSVRPRVRARRGRVHRSTDAAHRRRRQHARRNAHRRRSPRPSSRPSRTRRTTREAAYPRRGREHRRHPYAARGRRPRRAPPGRIAMNVSSPRVFRHRRILRISLDAYDHAIRLLAAAVRRRFAPVSAVVGIANGGLAPAGGISAILDVPNHRITAKHNPTNAVYIKATGHVTVDLDDMAAALHRQQLAGTVLLVDDICGSGATFSTVRSAIDPYLQP